MSRVDLDQSKAGSQRAAGSRFERGYNPVDPGSIERRRERVALGERNRARCDNRPAPFGRGLQPGTAFPWQIAASLTPGVGKLNARDSTLAVNKPSDPRQRLDVADRPRSPCRPE